MAFNTYPFNPYPASTEQINKGDNEELQEQIEELHEQIGDLSDLETSTKTSVVGAVNEVNTGLTGLSAHVDNDTDYAFAESITINNAVPSPAKNLKVKIVPTQSGTGTPSPDNVRPITGDTEASVSTTDGTSTNTATIALGQTVYGGEVNFDTGVLTVERAILTTTWGDCTSAAALTNVTRKRLPDLSDTPSNITAAISNITVYERSWDGDTPHFYVQPNKEGYIFLPTDTDNDTVIQICYELATPTTLNLTPAELTLLRGNNTVTTENNQVSLTASGVVGAIGELAEEVAANKLVNYSTTEQKTGRKWIDGKDIYQKTINCGAINGTSDIEIDHNITGIDTVISLVGILKELAGSFIPLPYATPASLDVMFRLSINATKIILTKGSVIQDGGIAYVTVRYTKTT